MQIVIKISDEFYEALKNGEVMISGLRDGKTFMSKICTAVANGTPLPKGHGDLIDVDSLDIPVNVHDGFEAMAYIEGVDPIIEADRSEVEE